MFVTDLYKTMGGKDAIITISDTETGICCLKAACYLNHAIGGINSLNTKSLPTMLNSPST